MRKTNLARLLARQPEGIFAAPFELGEIGPDLFDAACRMGLEGLVSKHRERAYRGGRCGHLDQGQEPGTSGVRPRAGSVLRSARAQAFADSARPPEDAGS
jgi:hypothetical protein